MRRCPDPDCDRVLAPEDLDEGVDVSEACQGVDVGGVRVHPMSEAEDRAANAFWCVVIGP